MRYCYLFVAFVAGWSIVNGQPPPDMGQVAALTENAQKFVELYGLAQQIMNLGGSIINNAQEGYSGSNKIGSGNYGMGGGNFGGNNYGSGNSKYGLSSNGIFGEVIKPQLRPASGNNFEFNKPSFAFSEYGGGPLGSGPGGVQSAKQSGLEALFNTFLGSSVSSPSSSSSSLGNFFSSSYQPEHASSGSNIDSIVNALIRSGAKQSQPDSGSQNILSQLFG